jgi:hypothetical protein
MPGGVHDYRRHDRLERLFQWPSALSSNWVDAINRWQQLCDVVPVSLGQNDIDLDALRVDEEVGLSARLTAIGWVRSAFSPRFTARTEELSATTREKSSLSAPRSLSSSTRCSLRPTPAFCQARNRRQQVILEPLPISCGSISKKFPTAKQTGCSSVRADGPAPSSRDASCTAASLKAGLDYFPQFIVNQFACHVASPR